MMLFAFHYFVINLVIQNFTVQSENVTNTVTDSRYTEINSTKQTQDNLNRFSSKNNSYEENGRILLILGIVADVVALTIPVFMYFCMTQYVHKEKRTQISHSVSRTSILKNPSNQNKFYTKFRIKSVNAKTSIPVIKCSLSDTSNTSNEKENSARSSLNFPIIHSSDVSLLTAVKRDCKILYPPSVEHEIESNEENTDVNKTLNSSESKSLRKENADWLMKLPFIDPNKPDIEAKKSENNELPSNSSLASNLPSTEREKIVNDDFSDNLKYYWPKYVTALQNPDTLQKKNKMLIDYYKAKKLQDFIEENDEYDKTKKDTETITTVKKVNNSSRYLRIDPPVNLDDPWISDEIRKKFNIPTFAPASHRTVGSKEAVNFSSCTLGTKSFDSHPADSMYNFNDVQEKKLPPLPPFNLGKQSLLPPTIPHPVSAKERRLRLNYLQCLPKIDNFFDKEDYKKTLHKVEEFRSKVTHGICPMFTSQSSSNSSDQMAFHRNSLNTEYKLVEKPKTPHVKASKSEKETSNKNISSKTNPTVEITLPKCVDMSRPASVPAKTSDNLISQTCDSSRRIVTTDVQNLGKIKLKKEKKATDSINPADGLPPSGSKSSSEQDSTTCKGIFTSLCAQEEEGDQNDSSSGDTIREMTFATPELLSKWKEKEEKATKCPLQARRRPPTKKRLQQEEIKRKKLLATKKKMEFHQQKRAEQQERFKKQREIQKQRYQLDRANDTSEMTLSKPWELKDFVEYERQEIERRQAKAGGRPTDSLTSGSFEDRYSPYRMRFMDESFMESVRLGKEVVYHSRSHDPQKLGVSETISSGLASTDSCKLLGPLFVKDEELLKGELPEYIFYGLDEKVSPKRDKTFYTMEYRDDSKKRKMRDE